MLAKVFWSLFNCSHHKINISFNLENIII